MAGDMWGQTDGVVRLQMASAGNHHQITYLILLTSAPHSGYLLATGSPFLSMLHWDTHYNNAQGKHNPPSRCWRQGQGSV